MPDPAAAPAPLLRAFADWLEGQGDAEAAALARRYGEASPLGAVLTLPGPVGERNTYALHPRGRILLKPATPQGLIEQMAAVLATGNSGTVDGLPLPAGLPAKLVAAFSADRSEPVATILFEGGAAQAIAAQREAAAMPDAIVPVHAADPERGLAYSCAWLLEEVSTSVNTTAAGGNASLMMIG